MYDIIKITTEKGTGNFNVDVYLKDASLNMCLRLTMQAATVFECAGIPVKFNLDKTSFSVELASETVKFGII